MSGVFVDRFLVCGVVCRVSSPFPIRGVVNSKSTIFFSLIHIHSHQSPGQYPGQTAHHRQHHANIRPRRRRIRLENRHVPPAVFLATDGVTGVECRHAVAHLGQLGILVRRRRDDGLVGRRRRKRRSRLYSSVLKLLNLYQMLRNSLVGRCCRGRWRCT